MLDFRKVLLALSVAGLGLVGTASAQTIITCGAVSTGTQTIAAEGTTDLIAPVTISGCAGSANSVTVILTSDVPFTDATLTSGALDVQAVASTTGVPASISASSITQSGNTITATFNLAGQTIAATGFTFTGLRVNGSAAPATSQITVAATGIAGGGFSDTAPASTVAYVYFTQITPTLAGTASVSLCSPFTTPTLATTLTIAENYPGSFATAAAASYTGSIVPSQGVVFAVTFNNLNAAGVNYYVPLTIGTGGMVLTAQTSATATTAASPASKIVLNTTTSATDPGVALTVAGGSATIYYAVTTAQSGGYLTAPIGLFETVPNTSVVSTPVTAPITASSVLVGVATGYPQYVAVSTPPVIAQPATPATNSLLTSCSTTLLFPYLVNQAGFDTGIVIANASTGLPGASASAGSCTVTFYGAGAPATAYNTGIIATGTTGSIVVSAVAPGFNGYAVASCNFTQAHADAFIGQFGAGGSLSGNYLAIVTNQVGGPGVSAPVAF